MKNNLFIISKNGYKYIAYALFIGVIFGVLDLEFFSLLSLLAALFFVYSFRNPEREVAFLDDKAVVSPVDGIVKAIDEVKEGEYAYKIVIESNYMNVGVLRSPLSGHLESTKIFRGARISKKSKLFYDLNENTELIFVDGYNNRVKVVHRLKQSFAPVAVDVFNKEKVQKGTRYGYAINSVSELYLPENFRLNVKLGNETQAANTLIGYFS